MNNGYDASLMVDDCDVQAFLVRSSTASMLPCDGRDWRVSSYLPIPSIEVSWVEEEEERCFAQWRI